MNMPDGPPDLCRRCWNIRGQVQGVGFRPFVFRTATRLELSGFVHNDVDGVTIESQGSAADLRAFELALRNELPPLAKVESITCEEIPIARHERDFSILSSCGEGLRQAGITIDTTVCEDCVAEMLSPADRRSGYGLINCTNCGPRFTIIRRLPYDRCYTTMSEFAMCEACRTEYADPANRRFHAQPIACHACGPRLQLVSPQGQPILGDPIVEAARILQTGRILAIKGLGGFHLAVRAMDPSAVARLRERKRRDAKPFAILCSDVNAARRLVTISRPGEEMLHAPSRPIVLAVRKPTAAIASAVAPNNHRLGIMLPYTPIHYLLLAHDPRLEPLVMTSGNITDEPLVIGNDEAIERIGPLCDGILWHDRPIQRCVDDSVVLDNSVPANDSLTINSDGALAVIPIRRSRGLAPQTIPIPIGAPSDASEGLCVGGELKNTIALVRGNQTILSQHLGDLKHPLAFQYFRRAIEDMQELFDVKPRWIAADLHPRYLSRREAQILAQRLQVPLLGIQHHHAHAAAVMAEHDRHERVLAVICDGTGYGTDNTIWGGELLLANLTEFQRLVRLRPLRLPGGDTAAKDIRRCGLALLRQLTGDNLLQHPDACRLVKDRFEREMLVTMLSKDVNCAQSSSMGRVFDGVAALLGLGTQNEFEAQAAMRLESAATTYLQECQTSGQVPVESVGETKTSNQRSCETWHTVTPSGTVASVWNGSDNTGQELFDLDLSPLVGRILTLRDQGVDLAELAYVFHESLATAWAAVVTTAAERTGEDCVVLSGGVFCNVLLTHLLSQRLTSSGLRVLRHAKVPPNDGGLAYGQAAIAAARMAHPHRSE